MSEYFRAQGPMLVVIDDCNGVTWINPANIAHIAEIAMSSPASTEVTFVGGMTKRFELSLNEFVRQLHERASKARA